MNSLQVNAQGLEGRLCLKNAPVRFCCSFLTSYQGQMGCDMKPNHVSDGSVDLNHTIKTIKPIMESDKADYC